MPGLHSEARDAGVDLRVRKKIILPKVHMLTAGTGLYRVQDDPRCQR
jgi:hypothetical protein